MRKGLSTAIVLSFVALLALMPLAGLAHAQGGGTTVASGFNGPMGVLVDADGVVWVIDSGTGGDQEVPFVNPQNMEQVTGKFGQSARVVSIGQDGEQTVVANLPSMVAGMDTLGGARLALLNGTLYATVGQWLDGAEGERLDNMAAVVRISEGEVTEVATTWDLESSQNPDPNIVDTHPYGLAAGPDGNLLVSDAGGNDLLRVNPDTGEVSVVTVFAGLPGPLPNPARGGAQESDPVPTGIAVNNGNVYVSFLAGFPFLPGSAKVVQVSMDGTVSDYATNLTSLTDVTAAPDGNLYAVQFAEFTEQGPTPNSGAIVRVMEGQASEVVVSGLSFPTSIDFNQNGDAYVTTNGVGAPGSGEVVRFDGLTSMEGTPIEAPETMPETGADTTPPLLGFTIMLGMLLVVAGLAVRRRANSA